GAQEAEPDPRREGQARVDRGDVGSQRRPATRQAHLGARPVLTRFARSVPTPARLRRAPQTPSASSTAPAVGLPFSSGGPSGAHSLRSLRSTPARLRRTPQTPSASSTALAVGLPPSIDLGA